MAVSGVEQPNPRAELTRRMERLCSAAAKVGEPLWFPANAGEHPPELEKLLSEYLDESHARSLGVVRLVPEAAEGGPAIAILAVEKFYGTLAAREQAMVAEVERPHGRQHPELLGARRRSFRADPPPPGRVGEGPPVVEGHWAAGLLAAIVAAALLLKADFNVVAEGVLEPAASLREVFTARTVPSAIFASSTGNTSAPASFWPYCGGPSWIWSSNRCWVAKTAQQKLVAHSKRNACRSRATAENGAAATARRRPKRRNFAKRSTVSKPNTRC